MYYPWAGMWWLVWLIPTILVIWAVAFSWGGRRYDRYGGWYGYRSRYPLDWDARWPRTHASRKHRNRAPRNYRRSDARIAEDVNDRLMLEDELDPSATEVRVESGVVILTGSVQSRFEKRLAEELADSVAGVADVDNRLQIRASQPAVQSSASEPDHVALGGHRGSV
jgi:BON domain